MTATIAVLELILLIKYIDKDFNYENHPEVFDSDMFYHSCCISFSQTKWELAKEKKG